MQLETTHGSLHRPRVLAPLAFGWALLEEPKCLWRRPVEILTPNHACHAPQNEKIPQALEKMTVAQVLSTSIINFAEEVCVYTFRGGVAMKEHTSLRESTKNLKASGSDFGNQTQLSTCKGKDFLLAA